MGQTPHRDQNLRGRKSRVNAKNWLTRKSKIPEKTSKKMAQDVS
jgi:hypothetical protein